MLPYVDGEATHHIKDLYHNYKCHVFQSFRVLLEDFFVGGPISGTECAYTSSAAQPQG